MSKDSVFHAQADVFLRIFKRKNPVGPTTWFFQLSRGFVKQERGPFTSFESCGRAAGKIMEEWINDFDGNPSERLHEPNAPAPAPVCA